MSTLITTTAQIGTLKDAGGNNTAMTIDNTGHVAMPNTKKGIFQVYANSNQTLNSNVTVPVQLDQKVFDTNSYFNTSTYRYTPQVAGYYVIEAQIMWEADPGDNIYMSAQIFKNGVPNHSTGASPYISGNGTAKPNAINSIVMGSANEAYTRVGTLVYFNGSSDYVDLRGYIYNYTDASASDNLIKGNANNLITWMYGYKID